MRGVWVSSDMIKAHTDHQADFVSIGPSPGAAGEGEDGVRTEVFGVSDFVRYAASTGEGTQLGYGHLAYEAVNNKDTLHIIFIIQWFICKVRFIHDYIVFVMHNGTRLRHAPG